MEYHLQASCVGWANSWRLSTVSTQHADLQDTNTAWKVSKYGVISGPYFPVFVLIYSVNLRIQSECRKIRTRDNSVFVHFSCSEPVAVESWAVTEKVSIK